MQQIFERDCIDKNLPGIIVASHGPLAIALVESARMIAGDMRNIAAFSIEPGDDPDEFGARMMEAYQMYPSGSIALLDLKGGTPFNQLYINTAHSGRQMNALCAVSMPMLLDANDLRETLKGKALIDELKRCAVDSLIAINRESG